MVDVRSKKQVVVFTLMTTLYIVRAIRGQDQLPFLREASRIESHQDVIRVAAEWAIEEISRRR